MTKTKIVGVSITNRGFEVSFDIMFTSNEKATKFYNSVTPSTKSKHWRNWLRFLKDEFGLEVD